jgi:hypothetical protein
MQMRARESQRKQERTVKKQDETKGAVIKQEEQARKQKEDKKSIISSRMLRISIYVSIKTAV